MLNWLRSPSQVASEFAPLEDQFRATLKSLAAKRPDGATPEWQANAAKLLKEANAKPVSQFTQWHTIKHSMFVSNAPYVPGELSRLQADSDWSPRWISAIQENAYGAPEIFDADLNASGNTIHHAHHLMTYERASGRQINDVDAIVEFGGGYGSLARVTRQAGFDGAYTIFDFPHFNALQNLFLSVCGFDTQAGGQSKPGVVTLTSEPADLEAAARAFERKLFVATWSLSETPLEVRNKVAQLLPAFDGILIAYQREFSGIDNIAWFDELGRTLSKTHQLAERTIPELYPRSGHYFFAYK